MFSTWPVRKGALEYLSQQQCFDRRQPYSNARGGKYPKYLQNTHDTYQISVAVPFVVTSWWYQSSAKENSVVPWLVSWVSHFLLLWNEIYVRIFPKKHSWIPNYFDRFSEAWTGLFCTLLSHRPCSFFCHFNHIFNESTKFAEITLKPNLLWITWEEMV